MTSDTWEGTTLPTWIRENWVTLVAWVTFACVTYGGLLVRLNYFENRVSKLETIVEQQAGMIISLKFQAELSEANVRELKDESRAIRTQFADLDKTVERAVTIIERIERKIDSQQNTGGN